MVVDWLSYTIIAFNQFSSTISCLRPLMCGDLDTPAADDCSISPGLDDVLEPLGLEQHVRSPIRNDPDHLLDLIITDRHSNIRNVRVVDSGLVSDKKIILASVDITSSADFESWLRQSSLFSSPTKDADSFADQTNPYINTTMEHSQITREI